MINDETVKSFCLVEDDTEPVSTVDRSTLERFSVCPAQARFIDSGRVNNGSHIAETGEAIHRALGAALNAYMAFVDDGEIMRPGQLADEVLTALRGSRPDVQADALDAARHTAWAWAREIGGIHPANILRFDGGEGERSGQLAWDLDGLGVRVTSELDLLVATESPQVLREYDYKSGWKRWTVSEVAQAFQFQTHSWLVLQNYPEIEALEIRVWDIRRNGLLYPVEFRRRDLGEWHARIASAAGEYWQHRNTVAQDAPVWPGVEKCSICAAAALCDAAKHAGDVAKDPARFVALMVATEAKLDAMRKLAGEYVDSRGADIVSAAGCFGANKPRTERKPTKQLYTIKTTEKPNESSE